MDILARAQHELHRKRQERAEWLQEQAANEPQPLRAFVPAAPDNGHTAAQLDALPLEVDPAERVTLDTLDVRHHRKVAEAVRAARAWAAEKNAGNNRISLVLVAAGIDGDINRTGYGCGKTHIARALQWSAFLEVDGIPIAPAGRFYTAKDAMELMASGNRIRELVPPSTHVLVLDDVGTEGTLPFISKEAQEYEKQTRYFQIVNYCYERGVSLVLTANMKLDELAAHIGGRAWSRLMEMAPAGYMVDLTGVPDWRRKSSGR